MSDFFSELIKEAKRKACVVKNSPVASGTEKILAESLENIIEALEATESLVISHLY